LADEPTVVWNQSGAGVVNGKVQQVIYSHMSDGSIKTSMPVCGGYSGCYGGGNIMAAGSYITTSASGTMYNNTVVAYNGGGWGFSSEAIGKASSAPTSASSGKNAPLVADTNSLVYIPGSTSTSMMSADGGHVYVRGLSASAEFNVAISGTVAIVFDDEGNVGYIATGGGGVGFLGASFTSVKGILSFDNIYQLPNTLFTLSITVSPSVSGIPIVVGGQAFWGQDGSYRGVLICTGLGAGSPLDYNLTPQPFTGTIVSGTKVSQAAILALKIAWGIS